MTKHLQKTAIVFFAFIIIIIGSHVIIAQTLTGEWKANYSAEKPDKIQINFSRRSSKGEGENNFGSSFDLTDLQNLNASQLSGANNTVRFSLAREAGTIECEGAFSGGKGAGTFRFTPNAQFVSAMQSRGFAFDADELFAAASLNLTVNFTDDLLSANFGKLETGDLFKAVIFKITPQFMSEMKASGFPNLAMEDLVKARIFKIDADFVRQISALGFLTNSFENLVQMKIFKITPEFIGEIRAEGFNDIKIEELVQMKIFKIDGAFIRRARAENVPMKVEKLVEKKIGVYGK